MIRRFGSDPETAELHGPGHYWELMEDHDYNDLLHLLQVGTATTGHVFAIEINRLDGIERPPQPVGRTPEPAPSPSTRTSTPPTVRATRSTAAPVRPTPTPIPNWIRHGAKARATRSTTHGYAAPGRWY